MTVRPLLDKAMPRLTDEVVTHHRETGAWRDALIDSFIADVAARHPDRTAIVDRGRRVTYAELDLQIDRFAACLLSKGLERHEIVSFQLPNWVEATVVHHGILRAGGVSNPIVPIYRTREVDFILRQAGSRFVIVPKEFRRFDYEEMYAELASSIGSLSHLWVVGGEDERSFERLMSTAWEGGEGGERLRQVHRSANDPALLLYTSGTTADPKGVIHSHNTLDYENRTIIDLMQLSGDDVIFMPSPVTHITGVLYGLQLPSMLETVVVFQDVWEPEEGLRLIAEEGCTFGVGATPFLHGLTYHPRLADFDVSSMRVFACGGADVPPQLILDASERLCPAVRVYGSTEYPTLSASAPHAPMRKRSRTDGHLIADAQAKIVDGRGAELAPNTGGELLVRGPEMFLGYLASSENPFTEDGWFSTGDLAVIDADGYVEIQGRKKDIILRGGENISAREVEDALFTHPRINEVAIVAYPDPVMTERACAVVVLEDCDELGLPEITEFLTARGLSIQKCPERLQVVDALPKTASGKVQKFKLREQLGFST